MMGRRGSLSPSSSLELLLDTMCNTFGGVMFIAISLIVIAALIPQSKSDSVAEQAAAMESLKNEIRDLEQKLDAMRERRKFSEEDLEKLKNDPRLSMIRKLADRLAENERMLQQMKIEELKTAQLKTESQLLTQQVTAQQSELTRNQPYFEKLNAEVKSVRSAIAEVKEELLSDPDMKRKMIFKKMTTVSDGSSPYFMIVDNQRLYRVGPDDMELIRTNPDVSLSKINNFYHCIPKTGTPIVGIGDISPAALQLITQLPKDRYPFFQVYPGSAKVFFDLVAQLKARRIPFAWAGKIVGEPSGFMLSSEGNYEKQ